MSEHFLSGDPPLPVILRRSARARRITLRISQLDGRVTLTLPNRTPLREALAFAESKRGWIAKHLADRPNDVVIGIGSEIPIEGRMHKIIEASGRRILIGDAVIAMPVGRSVGPSLRAALKTRARDRLSAASDAYANRLGRDYARLTLHDTRSRWGSCSSTGGLMYSWRLILTPPPVLAYVAAHEVAHLAEMNHSPAFWSLVEKLYGPYEEQRNWLRQNGAALHRYRFDD